MVEQEVKQLLKSRGFSSTKTRRSVLQAILRLQPATIAELIAALPEVDRATVYRTIDLFIDLAIVKHISTGMEQRIELGDNFQSHHHHLTCLRCGKVVDIHTPEIEAAIEQTAVSNLFRPIRHDLEISGYCSSCTN